VGSLITSYSVGVFLSGWVTTVVPEWRYAFFVGALPAVMAILLRLKLDEPEKWKQEKENQLATQYQVLPLKEIFQPQYRRNLVLGGTVFGSLLVGYWASLAWVPTWIQDLLGSQAVGIEKSIATQYHGIGSFIGCLLAGVLAEQWGRRWTIAIGSLGAFLVSAWMFLSNAHFSSIIYWQDALLGLFIGGLQGIIYIYLPELFPTRVRATAVGFCLNVGRFVTAIAVLFMGPLVSFFGGYAGAATAFACAYVIGVGAGLLGQETKGQILPE
jgi:MFS family permease